MPRYHFNVNGVPDIEAHRLADVRVAQCEGLAMAGRIIAEENSTRFWNTGDWGMEVTSPDGLLLFKLLLMGTEAPTIRKAAAPPGCASRIP